jgi:hypothetical protein
MWRRQGDLAQVAAVALAGQRLLVRHNRFPVASKHNSFGNDYLQEVRFHLQ